MNVGVLGRIVEELTAGSSRSAPLITLGRAPRCETSVLRRDCTLLKYRMVAPTVSLLRCSCRDHVGCVLNLFAIN